jgi:hypothetical protein
MGLNLNEIKAQQAAQSTNGKGFTPNSQNKAKRTATTEQPIAPPTQPTDDTRQQSNTIPTAREGAIALAATSAQAMNALQTAGLQNAAAFVQRKTAERNAIVDRVSDAIAYLSDPDLLESDILSAAATKVEARSNAWSYESDDTWDNLFALPVSAQRMLGGC